jgi:SET domain-containing protein
MELSIQRDAAKNPNAVSEWIEIRSSRIHGHGGFARKPIPAETRILEYLGERIDKRESARRCEEGNPFIFAINTLWDLDGNVPWNPARLLNHCCDPNCEARQDGDRVWIWSIRPIEVGEELTYNYGYDLTEWRDYPCACGVPGCVGFIVAEEYREHVLRQLAIAREAQTQVEVRQVT